jgi:hypothetical protein
MRSWLRLVLATAVFGTGAIGCISDDLTPQEEDAARGRLVCEALTNEADELADCETLAPDHDVAELVSREGGNVGLQRCATKHPDQWERDLIESEVEAHFARISGA